MRPISIIRFEQIYLAAIALSIASTLMSFEQTRAGLAGDQGAAQLGLGYGFLVGALVASIALMLGLWFLIARRASVVAKWLLVVITVAGLVMMILGLAATGIPGGLEGAAMFVNTALQLAAVAFLFPRDAAEWFASKGRAPVAPDVFH